MRYFAQRWFWVLVAFGVIITISIYSQTKESYSRKTGDTELLARVIRAEAEAEPYTGQVAVGAVILNRIQNPDFPNTLAGVIYEPRAFESVSNGMVNRPPTESARKAANAALSGWDPSGGAIFFFNPAKVGAKSYVWTRKIIQRIGKHVFAI
ncbi:MAG: cell wall hydrolase [Bacteroidota bacterium]